jgi:hypothetical protein
MTEPFVALNVIEFVAVCILTVVQNVALWRVSLKLSKEERTTHNLSRQLQGTREQLGRACVAITFYEEHKAEKRVIN